MKNFTSQVVHSRSYLLPNASGRESLLPELNSFLFPPADMPKEDEDGPVFDDPYVPSTSEINLTAPQSIPQKKPMTKSEKAIMKSGKLTIKIKRMTMTKPEKETKKSGKLTIKIKRKTMTKPDKKEATNSSNNPLLQ